MTRTLLALPLLFSFSVHAQSAGGLTPQQREQCVQERAQMVEWHAQLVATGDRLRAENAQIEATERGLEAQQAELALRRSELQALVAAAEAKPKAAGSGAELDAHFKSLEALREARERFNTQLKTYNDGVRVQQPRRERYNAEAIALNEELARYDAQAKAIDTRCARR